MRKRRLQRNPNRRPTARKIYRYTILIHPGEAGEKNYWVEVPALPGCFTQGQTIELCMEHAREAIEGYLESLARVKAGVCECGSR
jgi:predicted RNase H-like HicB family nuclease